MNRQTTATRGIRGIPGISPKWNSNVAHALLLAIFHYPINISSGRWEVDIPYDWEYGQWDRIHLYPIQVKVLVVKCVVCGEEYRIYPSFVLPGTTLTLSALIFVAFVYRFSELTWRDIPEKFCTEEDRISHSTLYKASCTDWAKVYLSRKKKSGKESKNSMLPAIRKMGPPCQGVPA